MTERGWVMVVEDEVELGRSLERKLVEEGYKVFVATNMTKATRACESRRFCCIVVDQYFDRSSGESLISEIRRSRDHVNYETPILLMSTFMNAEQLTTLEALVDATLEKPFERTVFAEKVGQLCDSKQISH